MAEKEIAVSNKHVKLRVALTISFFVIAVVAFAIGISSIGKKDPGEYEINAVANDDLPAYGSEFKGVFDFSGDEVGATYKQLEATFSESLQRSYCLFDETEFHTSVLSMSALNSHPNEEVEISEDACSVLFDALAKTHENKNYSIYAAPIYAYWDWLFSLDSDLQKVNDPKNHAENKELLEGIVKYCKEPYVKLELNGNNKAKLTVSEEYLNFREENNITAPIVSLNVLKNAYRLQMVADLFIEKGYTFGYIYHTDGYYISLKDHRDPIYSLYDINGNSFVKYAVVQIGKPSCAVMTKRFTVGNPDYNPYYVLDDGTIRNNVINISTGYGDQYYASTSLFGKSNNVVEIAYQSNYLSTLSLTEATNFLNEKYCSFTLSENDKKAYTTSRLVEYITINTDKGYNLSQL